MRFLIVLAVIGLVACGGDEGDCAHEIESGEGVSLCMPTEEDMGLCVIDPVDQCGGLCAEHKSTIAYVAPGEDGPVVVECGCTSDKGTLDNCNKARPLSSFPGPAH